MAKDKMWNGIGWYGFIGVITTSTTDISLGYQQTAKVTTCWKRVNLLPTDIYAV